MGFESVDVLYETPGVCQCILFRCSSFQSLDNWVEPECATR